MSLTITMKNSTQRASLVSLVKPKLTAEWFDEPLLTFADGATHVDPKVGVNLYGPRSFGTSRHRSEIHFGFIGSGESIENTARFYTSCAAGVSGDNDHEPFPGCDKHTGFRTDLKIDTSASEIISEHDLTDIKSRSGSKARFEATVDLLDEKFRLLKLQERPIDYVVLALPGDLYELSHSVDYKDSQTGMIHRDLRRAFKVLAMRHEKPTQIVRDRTVSLETISRLVDHKAVRAWNLFTGMYFKVDGIPWVPCGLDSETCYVGVAFYKPNGTKATLRASLAQAFDDRGEGFVLRGREFEWDEDRDGRSPHLPEDAAQELVTRIVTRYREERKTLPRRVVVHKSSEFWPPELSGFRSGLKNVASFDLVALRSTSQVRLIREATYPPLRGTAFHCGDVTYFYTTGYIKSLERYPHGHVPSPIEISDHHGDSSKAQLIREILGLSRMNWNTAAFAGAMPITLRFARLVGEILREMPTDFHPQPRFKYYT
jgi:hypothetical protein